MKRVGLWSPLVDLSSCGQELSELSVEEMVLGADAEDAEGPKREVVSRHVKACVSCNLPGFAFK